MYIKIKRAPCAFEQTGEYERVHVTHFLTDLISEDRKELDDDTLFALHRYLSSGRAPKGSLELSGLDGLLTAVIASCDGVGIIDWMPAIWGDEEPVLEDMAEAQRVFAAITRRYRQVAGELLEGGVACILQRDPAGELHAGAWCRGFLRGVMLSPEQWTPAFRHGLGQEVLLPIAAVAADDGIFDLFDPLVEQRGWDRVPDLAIALGTPFCLEYLTKVWADLRTRAKQVDRSISQGNDEPEASGIAH